MLTGCVDLHTHSNCSDGSMSPSQLVAHAAEKGLAAIALTDHDTVDGIKEAVAKGEECGSIQGEYCICGVRDTCEKCGVDNQTPQCQTRQPVAEARRETVA